jgi:hypothetical protein
MPASTEEAGNSIDWHIGINQTKEDLFIIGWKER